mmetsp:Transcript_2496/g.5998  ORF Transcript_2496/g.5998 Transcript_2496/m.5998 type:complete len:235 (-) Transcript_2496:590-1294(-)
MDLRVALLGVVDLVVVCFVLLVLVVFVVVLVSATTPLGRTFPADWFATPLGSSFPREPPAVGDFMDFFWGDDFFVPDVDPVLLGVALDCVLVGVLDFPSPSLSVNLGFLFGGGLPLAGDPPVVLTPAGGAFPRDTTPAPVGGVLPREMVAPVARAAGCLSLILGFDLSPPSFSLSLGKGALPLAVIPFAIFVSIFCCSRLAIFSICCAGETIHFVVSLSEWYLMAFSKMRLQSS